MFLYAFEWSLFVGFSILTLVLEFNCNCEGKAHRGSHKGAILLTPPDCTSHLHNRSPQIQSNARSRYWLLDNIVSNDRGVWFVATRKTRQNNHLPTLGFRLSGPLWGYFYSQWVKVREVVTAFPSLGRIIWCNTLNFIWTWIEHFQRRRIHSRVSILHACFNVVIALFLPKTSLVSSRAGR